MANSESNVGRAQFSEPAKQIPSRLLARAVMTLARCAQKLKAKTKARSRTSDRGEHVMDTIANAATTMKLALRPRLVNDFARSSLERGDVR